MRAQKTALSHESETTALERLGDVIKGHTQTPFRNAGLRTLMAHNYSKFRYHDLHLFSSLSCESFISTVWWLNDKSAKKTAARLDRMDRIKQQKMRASPAASPRPPPAALMM